MTKLTQTVIRRQLDTLKHVGDTTVFIPTYQPTGHLRSKIKQSAAFNKISVQLRTINGEIHTRRTDFPNVLPGTIPPPLDMLRSMAPWADDPYFDEKVKLLARLTNET